MKRLMKRSSIYMLVGLFLFMTVPVQAGRYVLKMKGAMNVVADPLKFETAIDKDGNPILDKYGDPEIIPVVRGAAHIASAKHRGSAAEMRLMGAVVDFIEAPPYYFEYGLGDIVQPKRVKGQEKAKPILIEANRWYTIEFYVITVDDRGKKVRDGELAATGEFMIEDTLTLDIEQASTQFEQVINQLKQELANARQEYERVKAERDAEAKRLTDAQKKIEAEYEAKVADYEKRIKELETKMPEQPSVAPTQIVHDGIVLVMGAPSQTVTVQYEIAGRLTKTDRYTFVDSKDGSSLRRIFTFGDVSREVVVTAVYEGAGRSSFQLGPIKMNTNNRLVTFSGVNITDTLRGRARQ